MSPSSAFKEPVVSVSYRRSERADGDAQLRAKRAVLTLARLIGRQIAREQHAARRERDENAK
jgi:hypothetical protein